jgi:hypothetical protein
MRCSVTGIPSHPAQRVVGLIEHRSVCDNVSGPPHRGVEGQVVVLDLLDRLVVVGKRVIGPPQQDELKRVQVDGRALSLRRGLR